MPAKTKNQAVAARIAKHVPSKLFKRNRGFLKMPKKTLHEFAATKNTELLKRSTKGSPSMDSGELGAGYRVLQRCPGMAGGGYKP